MFSPGKCSPGCPRSMNSRTSSVMPLLSPGSTSVDATGVAASFKCGGYLGRILIPRDRLFYTPSIYFLKCQRTRLYNTTAAARALTYFGSAEWSRGGYQGGAKKFMQRSASAGGGIRPVHSPLCFTRVEALVYDSNRALPGWRFLTPWGFWRAWVLSV